MEFLIVDWCEHPKRAVLSVAFGDDVEVFEEGG